MRMEPVASVGNEEMDEEHEACETALRTLAETREVRALEEVISAIESHFAHEEQLLDTCLYGKEVAATAAPSPSVGSSLSSFSLEASERESHWNDHRRILSSLRKALALVKGKGAADGGEVKVPIAIVAEAMRDFSSHADRYDNNYAERLAAATAGEAKA